MLPEVGPGQQRAMTYLWAATQVAAAVVRDAFVQIYTSLPDSGDGHTTIREYCSLAGRSGVYLELLDEGCLSSHLAGSPREAVFLDLKVTRKMLEKVLADKFCCATFGKLTFEVRQLVYLRNDLCHQLLPSLPAKQYLTCMEQLETRLCSVTRLAALIAGDTDSPHAALNHTHALFVSLLSPDNELTLHITNQTPRTDSGTQTDLQQATQEKGVQVNTILDSTTPPPVIQDGKINPLWLQTKTGSSGSLKHDHDSVDPGIWRRVRGGVDGTRGARRHGRQQRQGSYHNAGRRARRSTNSLHHRGNDTHAKGKKLLDWHITETSPEMFSFFIPGHSLTRDKLCKPGILTQNRIGHRPTTLVHTPSAMNHNPYTPHEDIPFFSILNVTLYVMVMAVSSLGVLLESAVSFGINYLCVRGRRLYHRLLERLCYGKRKRKAVYYMAEMVFIPHVVHEHLCGPPMMRPDKDINDFWKSGWKAPYRRKKRKNTRSIN